MFPPRRSPYPWFQWMWPYYKQGLCRCNQVKMREYWVRVGPKPNNWCPYKEREIEVPEKHVGKDKWPQRQRWVSAVMSQGTPQIASKHQVLGRSKIVSWCLQTWHGPADTWSETSSPQNWKRIHFCCEPPSLWLFVIEVLENYRNSQKPDISKE